MLNAGGGLVTSTRSLASTSRRERRAGSRNCTVIKSSKRSLPVGRSRKLIPKRSAPDFYLRFTPLPFRRHHGSGSASTAQQFTDENGHISGSSRGPGIQRP